MQNIVYSDESEKGIFHAFRDAMISLQLLICTDRTLANKAYAKGPAPLPPMNKLSFL